MWTSGVQKPPKDHFNCKKSKLCLFSTKTAFKEKLKSVIIVLVLIQKSIFVEQFIYCHFKLTVLFKTKIKTIILFKLLLYRKSPLSCWIGYWFLLLYSKLFLKNFFVVFTWEIEEEVEWKRVPLFSFWLGRGVIFCRQAFFV